MTYPLELLQAGSFPLSFEYGGKQYRALKDFRYIDGLLPGTARYMHDKSNTVWTITAVWHQKHSALLWRAELMALADTEVFDRLEYDFCIPCENAVLHGNLGDENGGYASFEDKLDGNGHLDRSLSGRPTHNRFPYYCLEYQDGSVNVVLSWQGTWFAHFSSAEQGTRVRAGQDGLKTMLFKGETLRMPMMVVQMCGQDHVNMWRRFYMDCIMPRMDGLPVPPMLGAGNGRCDSLDAEIIAGVKQWYDGNAVPYDFWWFDAGWGSDGISSGHRYRWWYNGASLEINRQCFPDGLAGMGRQLAEHDKKFMMWFEPELVRTPDEAMEEFYKYNENFDPDWFLGVFSKEWCGVHLTARLLDLGNTDCRRYVEQHIFNVMDTAGANIFRIDMNIDPVEIWSQNDVPGRQGITQNKYCQGYLSMLEDIKRHGVHFMDSCASGGGRNDLETLMYMLPLHYSDHQDIAPGDSDGFIYMQQILYKWFPCVKNFISLEKLSDQYALAAALNPFMVWWLYPDLTEPFAPDSKAVKVLAELWETLKPYWYSDYYLLNPPSNNSTDIKAHEFFDKEANSGFALVFCPGLCTQREYILRIKGLAGENYKISINGEPAPFDHGAVPMQLERGRAYIVHISGA